MKQSEGYFRRLWDIHERKCFNHLKEWELATLTGFIMKEEDPIVRHEFFTGHTEANEEFEIAIYNYLISMDGEEFDDKYYQSKLLDALLKVTTNTVKERIEKMFQNRMDEADYLKEEGYQDED